MWPFSWSKLPRGSAIYPRAPPEVLSRSDVHVLDICTPPPGSEASLMALLLKATGGGDEIHPANGRTFTLEELQALVGGYIEIVRARDLRWLVLNEDGKRLELPANDLATLVYRAAGGPLDVVVGDVLLATRLEIGADDV